MIVIGLTGGIATGKSTTAKMIMDRGIPLHDADATVHKLMAAGGPATGPVANLFGADMLTVGGAVDRRRLGRVVFADTVLRKQLEAVIHPLVAADRDAFLEEQRLAGAPVVVLDIPLLFETGAEALCDFVILCSAPDEVQRQRAMARDGMTKARFDAILASQMPLAEKRAMADAEIDTGLGLDKAGAMLDSILEGPVRDLHQETG
ncbi:MAG: dephospho-CoA kinase [Pseudomonadota bacterium]|nr:dephospho-CoA kinase [Pseudomonadota bacterium]